MESLQQQLQSTEAAAAAAAAALVAATSQRAALAEEVQAYEGNKEERLARSKAAIGAAEKEVRA
eukprot:4072559-Pleurochrysis_carterae.AAC.1